jgi:hypothetical protein
MPNVSFVRKELKLLLSVYYLIRDCIEGEKKIKQGRTKYLPMPNAADESKENQERYKAYIERAVFYNVTRRTLAGLNGQVFYREPVVEVPNDLDKLIADANGAGVDLIQLAKRAVLFVLAFGRAGVFTDYPATEGTVTREQIENGEIRPTVEVFAPWDVINWQTEVKGSKRLLTLVVLRESYFYSLDGFEIKEGEQWRELRLIDGVYTLTIWEKKSGVHTIKEGPFIPTDAKGEHLNEIPFSFIGCENNDEFADYPPLYDLASLNIAHYRNSADYEEACFITGQPTPVFAGLTEDWVTGVLKGSVQLGSRGAVPLPVGGSASLLQVTANSMPIEAMKHKEEQMIALGAKLVEQSSVQRTATEANIENASETSVLSSSATNVSKAFQFALEKAALFVGTTEEIKFVLNTDFNLSNMTPEERGQLVKEWQAGAIAFEELRTGLRKSGVATLDDKEAETKIKAELENAVNLAMDKTKQMPKDKTKGVA